MAHASLPLDLHSAANVREMDRRTIAGGVPGYTLMCRAAAACVAAIEARWPRVRRIDVLCGGGNNGGDGYVVARLLHLAGRKVRVLYLVEPQRLHGDAATAWSDARSAGVSCVAWRGDDAFAHSELLVDALLGTGLERPVAGAFQAAIAAANAAHARGCGVLAVDIPSGLAADSGAELGLAVQADVTVSFIALKAGLFTGAGPACCGQVRFDDLGATAAAHALPALACRYQADDLATLLAPRRRDQHKGDHGHVLVIGGDHGMGGAARMCAEAAARVGSGLVSVATRTEHAGVQAAARPELMFRGVEQAAELQPLLARASVLALGPGLGQSAWSQALFAAVLAAGRPLLIDADGLNLLATHPQRRDDWVLTPHPGEAARLLGSDTATVQAERFSAARALAARYGGTVVLKGAGTLIASGEAVFVVNTGNPGMGSGGMGDVLSGVIAGLLAQRLTPLDAARLGVWLHGRAGDLAAADGERGLLASDLFAPLRRLVNP